MNTIKVQRGLGTITISENTISELLDNVAILESIILMYVEGSDTFENRNEVEFPKKESNDFLLQYFLNNTDYSKQYINKIFTK